MADDAYRLKDPDPESEDDPDRLTGPEPGDEAAAPESSGEEVVEEVEAVEEIEEVVEVVETTATEDWLAEQFRRTPWWAISLAAHTATALAKPSK